MENEGRHELVILLWVHPLLEIGESTGENHRFFIPIVCTYLVLTALGGINLMQILYMLLQHHGVSNMMQASSSHRAATMLTYPFSSVPYNIRKIRRKHLNILNTNLLYNLTIKQMGKLFIIQSRERIFKYIHVCITLRAVK